MNLKNKNKTAFIHPAVPLEVNSPSLAMQFFKALVGLWGYWVGWVALDTLGEVCVNISLVLTCTLRLLQNITLGAL